VKILIEKENLILFEKSYYTMSSLKIIEEYLTRYGMSTYLILGNFGNLFNIIIFCQKSHRNNSCSLYLLVASIMNIFIINFGVIPTLYSLYYINPEIYSNIYCKLRLYLLHSTLMISRSMMVLACIDRFAVSSTSNPIHLFGQPKIAIRFILLISFIWPIIASHILVLLKIKSGCCNAYGKYSLIYSIYSFIVAGFLPPTLMITFGFLTIHNLRHIHSRVRPNIIRITHMRRKDYDLSIMLICEVIVYFISTIPYPIQTLYLTITRDIIKSSYRLKIESFITFLSYSFLIYINSASTFYVYIGTSHAYRRQCRRFIIHFWRKIKNLHIERAANEHRYILSRRQRTTSV
jgi:hypothetical protein